MDRLADVVEWQVVVIVPERPFNLDADLLDTEEGIADEQHRQNGLPAERLDECKRQRQAVNHESPAQMYDIGKRQRRLANPLAAAELVHQRLHDTFQPTMVD